MQAKNRKHAEGPYSINARSCVSTFFFLTDKGVKERTSSKLGLPLSYDRRYKINVALLSKDVTDVTGYSTTGTKKGIKV